MKISLRFKVTASVGVVLVVVFSALLVADTNLVTRELSAKAHRSSQMVSLTVEKSLRESMMKRRRPEIAAIISSVGELPDIRRIAVTDGDGRAVFEANSTEHVHLDSQTRDMIASATRTGGLISRGLKGEILRTISPIRNEKRCWSCHGSEKPYLGHLLLDLSTHDDKVELSRIRKTILTGGIAALTFGVITLLLTLTRLVYRPIGQLMSAMTKIKEGDVSARADTSGGDELRRLSEALNAMVISLEQQNAEIVMARERLLEARRLSTVGLLVAGMAHEINNPTGAILVATEGLAPYLPDDGPGAKLLGLVRRSAERISSLVSDLLRFDPNQPMGHEPLDINTVVTESVDSATGGLAGPDHEIRFDLTAEGQSVVGDKGRLRQALTNIISNAFEAMPSGGVLTIRTSANRKETCVEVSDTGCGVTAEDLPLVMDPFFTTKEPGKGRGLGLAVAREIIAQHGGELTLSGKPGEGSTVRIRIPRPNNEHTV